ncbi:uncharacterized protein LOC116013121 [Ipomoea triloba]|uniref:uncharacterized protein LOC116013121 n=1 Tax=Ipomoea triloba TaxID=35885 RepID=UPI00125DE5CE|nr:uncharacterized protein LOC116013121 [Ipomoea triloba]
MDELQKKIDEKDGSPKPQDVLTTPFMGAVMEEPFPKDFRFPTIKTYSGTSDPRAHLNRYRAAMLMTGASDAIMCRGFFSTLDGQAQDWFGSLPEGSISTFAALTKRFMSYFASNVQKRKEFADLYHVKQLPTDSLPEFLNKWKREVLGVANFDDRAAIIIFRNNLRSGPFYRDLIRYPPKTYNEQIDRATRFAEEEVAEKQKKEEEEGRSRKDKAPQEERRAPRPPCREFAEGPRLTPTRFLTPLTEPVSTFLDHVEGQGIVQYPGECMKISPKVDPNKYYRFHRQTGHNTDECIHLKHQIEDLIQRGYLGQFVKRPRGQGQNQSQGNVWRKGGGSTPSTSAHCKREDPGPGVEPRVLTHLASRPRASARRSRPEASAQGLR